MIPILLGDLCVGQFQVIAVTHDGAFKYRQATRIFEQVGTAGLNPEILFEKKTKK